MSSERQARKARPVPPQCSRSGRAAFPYGRSDVHITPGLGLVTIDPSISRPADRQTTTQAVNRLTTLQLCTMAFRASLRPVALAARSTVRTGRAFHSTPAALIKVGDSIPYLDVLREGSPANSVNLAEEFSAEDGIIIGVPGAFSTSCLFPGLPAVSFSSCARSNAAAQAPGALRSTFLATLPTQTSRMPARWWSSASMIVS